MFCLIIKRKCDHWYALLEEGERRSAVPTKREDGTNSLAIYHAHHLSLMSFKDHCDVHFPMPSAKGVFSIQLLLGTPPADPDAPATSTRDALGNRTYPSRAGFSKAYVRDSPYSPSLPKSSQRTEWAFARSPPPRKPQQGNNKLPTVVHAALTPVR